MRYNIVRVYNRGVFMNSGNNGQSTARKVFVGVIMALAVVVLILFATGRLDSFFSADDLIFDEGSSQSISDNIGDVNGTDNTESSSDSSAYVSSIDSAENSESVPESTVESESSVENSESASESQSSAADSDPNISDSVPEAAELHFRNANLLEQHYQKHGIDMGFNSAEEYEKAAAAVPFNPDALHKTEAEDGDDVYYIESTNEFVVVSTDGYLRTYFNPDRGKDYFDRQ